MLNESAKNYIKAKILKEMNKTSLKENAVISDMEIEEGLQKIREMYKNCPDETCKKNLIKLYKQLKNEQIRSTDNLTSVLSKVNKLSNYLLLGAGLLGANTLYKGVKRNKLVDRPNFKDFKDAAPGKKLSGFGSDMSNMISGGLLTTNAGLNKQAILKAELNKYNQKVDEDKSLKNRLFKNFKKPMVKYLSNDFINKEYPS